MPHKDPEARRAYYQANRERELARHKQFQLDNKVHLAEYMRQWRSANKSKYLLTLQRSKLRHKDAVHERVRRRKLLKRRVTIVGMNTEAIVARIAFYGNKCAYCGGPYEHLDHVIPLARGGKHCPANLRPACARCNLSKKDKSLKDWLASRK